MIQRSKGIKKEDIYGIINKEERKDKVRFYIRATLSTSLVILILIGYCLIYVAKGTAEYYVCLFTLGINILIILLVIMVFRRLKIQTSHVRKK